MLTGARRQEAGGSKGYCWYSKLFNTKLRSYVAYACSPRPRVPASPRQSGLLCLNATRYNLFERVGYYRHAVLAGGKKEPMTRRILTPDS